jgi:TraB/PrgY/gumN family
MAFLGFFTSIFLGFFTFQNTFPGKLSDITLTYSGQTVLFLEMSHIAHPNFYLQKKENIKKLADQWYVVLVEWVQSWTIENEKKLSQALGFELTRSLYSTIANIAWLDSQDNAFLFWGIAPENLVSVDISIDQMMNILNGTWSRFIHSDTPPLDIEKQLREIGDMNLQEKQFLSFLIRGILNFAIKNEDFLDESRFMDVHPELMNVILHERNRTIIEYIESHPNKNIVVVYGALHFPGVLEGLKKNNPHWKIKSFESFTPYAP